MFSCMLSTCSPNNNSILFTDSTISENEEPAQTEVGERPNRTGLWSRAFGSASGETRFDERGDVLSGGPHHDPSHRHFERLPPPLTWKRGAILEAKITQISTNRLKIDI